jgi:RimJ/RimL family protein N-acetyltransferase
MVMWRQWQADDEIRRLVPPDNHAVNLVDFAIDLDGRLIGFCHLFNVTDDESELGIWIGDKNFWGKGYGAEAIRQLVSFCFNKGLKRVYLKTLWSNFRAMRCYEKCGFTRYGHLAQDGHSWVLMELYNK